MYSSYQNHFDPFETGNRGREFWGSISPIHPFASASSTICSLPPHSALVAQLVFLLGRNLDSYLEILWLATNMISHSLALLLLSRFALGAVTPIAPGPGEVFTAGSTCSVSWTPDESGEWKSFSIGL